MLLLFILNYLCYVKTSNIALDLVTKIIVHFYIDFTSRFLKQIWLFPYPCGFFNPIRIHGMKINDMIWYDMIWYDMIWYDMIWYDTWYDTARKCVWKTLVFESVILHSSFVFLKCINPLNAELNPICHLLELLRAHPILHVSRIRVNVNMNTHLKNRQHFHNTSDLSV